MKRTLNLDAGAFGLHASAKLPEQLLRVLDGVALREGIRLHQDFAVLAQENGF